MADNIFKQCHSDKALGMTRRWLLCTLGVGAMSATLLRSTSANAAQRTSEGISQPEGSDDMAYIRRAFEMRRLAIEYGDQAYGAVVVQHGKIIGQSWSRVILDHDPTGHAEISAIRDAALRMKNRNLGGAILYSSSRPCPMCEAAAYWSGIDEMIFGKAGDSAGAPRLCR